MTSTVQKERQTKLILSILNNVILIMNLTEKNIKN